MPSIREQGDLPSREFCCLETDMWIRGSRQYVLALLTALFAAVAGCPAAEIPAEVPDVNMQTSAIRLAHAGVVLLSLYACGGGGSEPEIIEEQDNPTPPVAVAANLPPVSSRYVRLEGSARLLSDAAGRGGYRVNFETFAFRFCNDQREERGLPRQEFPSAVLDVMDRMVEEQMYDAATGAARIVEYGRPIVTLTDVWPAVAAARAPDCLAHTVHQPVFTSIWGSDGYRYEFNLGSPYSAGTARRFVMGHPDDLNWRVLPVDLSAQPRRTIADASCRDFPTVAHVLGGVIDQCRLQPDDDITFRNLPLVLRDVTVTGVLNGAPTAASEEHTFIATTVTTERAGFGEWGNQPVDALPVLPPGVTLFTR